MAEISHLENRHEVIFFCRRWSDFDKISETGAEWHVDGGMWSKLKPDVEFQYGGRLDEFNGMSSQSHVSHCRVQPLDKFTVTIPEPHATLQNAVTWRNQCHDRATLQGVRIPSAILKIVFTIFHFLLFLMQFRLWRASAVVSSPIHLLLLLLKYLLSPSGVQCNVEILKEEYFTASITYILYLCPHQHRLNNHWVSFKTYTLSPRTMYNPRTTCSTPWPELYTLSKLSSNIKLIVWSKPFNVPYKQI